MNMNDCVWAKVGMNYLDFSLDITPLVSNYKSVDFCHINVIAIANKVHKCWYVSKIRRV